MASSHRPARRSSAAQATLAAPQPLSRAAARPGAMARAQTAHGGCVDTPVTTLLPGRRGAGSLARPARPAPARTARRSPGCSPSRRWPISQRALRLRPARRLQSTARSAPPPGPCGLRPPTPACSTPPSPGPPGRSLPAASAPPCAGAGCDAEVAGRVQFYRVALGRPGSRLSAAGDCLCARRELDPARWAAGVYAVSCRGRAPAHQAQGGSALQVKQSASGRSIRGVAVRRQRLIHIAQRDSPGRQTSRLESGETDSRPP